MFLGSGRSLSGMHSGVLDELSRPCLFGMYFVLEVPVNAKVCAKPVRGLSIV